MVGYFRIISLSLMISLLPALNAPLIAAQPKSDLLNQLQQILANPKQRSRALFVGEERALICGYCHGNDGNSVKPEVPNLAGQNPDYLLQQVGHFASGEREDFVMNSLASKFTEMDQINLAIFYASQKVKAVRVDQVRAQQGKRLYQLRCQACHGINGRGKASYARLAGQKAVYIKITLENFRDNSLGKLNHKKRRSKIMESIARRLTDRHIQNLAAYIASM